jgi:hypothetical protein
VIGYRAYNARMKFRAAFLMVALAAPAMAQSVSPGQPVPVDCERLERIKPNLVLSGWVLLGGRIRDSNGDPVKGSIVELRLFENEYRQTFVKKVTTDDEGLFRLGMIPKGRYRLLASPTRAFKQVDWLDCGSGGECSLPIVLEADRTDMPIARCPVR